MANFRALQPAPMDDEAPSQPQSRPLLAQKPKRTVTLGACVACRKRKSKCDGNRPVCTCCTQKDTECIYELGPNEKPSQAMKRKNEEMQGELNNLRQLYDFIRLRPEEDAMEILRRIRANPSNTSTPQRIQELADFVRHGDPQPQQQQQPPQPPPPPPHQQQQQQQQQPPHIHPQPQSQPQLQSPPPQPPRIQDDLGKSVTLPPLRYALDSPSSMDPHAYPLPGIMYMGSEEPLSQRRRFTSDADVSARSGSHSSLPPLTSIDAMLSPCSVPFFEDSGHDPRMASARNWTTVTDETQLLISILTTWSHYEYSYWRPLDRDAFLDDMANGRTNFCSELLVNALLATGCTTCPAVMDRSKPFSEVSVMTAFYKEARRLWVQGKGSNSITRMQAGLCLYLFLGKHGRDKEGHEYLLEACQIGQSLGLFQPQSPKSCPKPYNVVQEDWDRTWAITAWALFNFQLTMAFVYTFPPPIKVLPPVPIPCQHASNSEDFFLAECTKNIIILDCLNTVQGTDMPKSEEPYVPSTTEIEKCYKRLMAWWDKRPLSIQPDKFPSKENFLHAMVFHADIICLFQPILSHQDKFAHEKSYVDYAQSVTFAATREIQRLLELQELRHGWANSITFILHPINVAGFSCLSEISQTFPDLLDAETSEQYRGLLVSLRALTALANYNYYAQPLFRLLTQKCQDMNLRLPVKLKTAMDNYRTEEWTRTAANLVSSQYIADVPKTVKDTEAARMDAIISSWEGLNLDDQDKGKKKVT